MRDPDGRPRELDLTRQQETERWLAAVRPHVVIVAAARVGGILANNSYPVDFLADNLAIELNLIRASHSAGVEKLLFLGSTCIYPKFAKQPMSEDQLLTGELEPTNEWYAIAKIAGIKLCEAYRQQLGNDFISVMPTNLYGPGDNYHPENSHVAAALIRRFHEAKVAGAPTVTAWGTGTPRREFLYVDDFADACIFVLKNYSSPQMINIGVGKDISIAEFADIVADIVDYRGKITFDPSKPDGAPRKLVDVSRLSSSDGPQDAASRRAKKSLRRLFGRRDAGAVSAARLRVLRPGRVDFGTPGMQGADHHLTIEVGPGAGCDAHGPTQRWRSQQKRDRAGKIDRSPRLHDQGGALVLDDLKHAASRRWRSAPPPSSAVLAITNLRSDANRHDTVKRQPSRYVRGRVSGHSRSKEWASPGALCQKTPRGPGPA